MKSKLNIIFSERGTALVFTILTIGILLNIVFFLTSVFAFKLRIASGYDDSVTALYASDSGIEWRLYNLLKDPDAIEPVLTNGATMVFKNPPGISPIDVVGKFRGISRSFIVSFSEVLTPTPGPTPTPTPGPTPIPTPTPTPTPVSWWNLAWLNRKAITFNNSPSSTNLDNFPVLVVLTPSNIDYSKVKAGGADLRFIDENDLTELSYEIETWNSGGTSNVWVKVPRINASSTTDFIFMYYNNPLAIDSQNPNVVWNDSFAGVWHLPNGITLNVNDSTGKNNGDNKAVSVASAKVNGGGRFNGSASNITTGTIGMATGFGAPWTIEAWLNTDVLNNQYHVAVGYGTGGTPGASPMIGISDTNRWQVQTWGCLFNCVNNGPVASTGTWTHVVGVGNGTNLTLYLNGIQSASTVVSSNSPTNARATIGGSAQAPVGFLWNGFIDEVRISSTARSSDWIRATYLTENLQMNTFGLEQNKP